MVTKTSWVSHGLKGLFPSFQFFLPIPSLCCFHNGDLAEGVVEILKSLRGGKCLWHLIQTSGTWVRTRAWHILLHLLTPCLFEVTVFTGEHLCKGDGLRQQHSVCSDEHAWDCSPKYRLTEWIQKLPNLENATWTPFRWLNFFLFLFYSKLR